MASDLYDRDIATWSEQQADLLRRLARGERVNGVDWENVAEEIESVGRSEVKGVASQLRMALVHGLKLAHWPTHPACDAWRSEIGNFLGQARDSYEPAMAQRIDPPLLFAKAMREVAGLRMTGFDKLSFTPPTLPDIATLMDDEFDAAAVEALFSEPR